MSETLPAAAETVSDAFRQMMDDPGSLIVDCVVAVRFLDPETGEAHTLSYAAEDGDALVQLGLARALALFIEGRWAGCRREEE